MLFFRRVEIRMKNLSSAFIALEQCGSPEENGQSKNLLSLANGLCSWRTVSHGLYDIMITNEKKLGKKCEREKKCELQAVTKIIMCIRHVRR